MNGDVAFEPRVIEIGTKESEVMFASIRRAMRLTAEMNKLSFDDAEEVRRLFSELTGRSIDRTFSLIPPFYTDHGINIRVGKNVFINQCCTLMDIGGIDIADDVMIGPKVNLVTSSHPVEPAERRARALAEPISLKKNVWISTAATILAGVTVGEYSVVAAGAVVTRDVPPNSLVAGVPARVIREFARPEPVT
ncbi:sugar O-acetyltransferase [Chondromyces apiculatus]|uniref:Nodulation protein L n=1 Tax=Chondromyces apiculatus DSM 436 TaxID=1192034 RepID=A0A017T2M7_9BACT|nr:sugar O-acetyltransferase [Chondromyces apiculatus]EYF03252.1 Acetyltransferase (isoleucine patch superfamily) [Chondromyces apiculatus DSM 436]